MSLMSVLFWRCEEAKWKPHVERILRCLLSMKKSGLRNQLLVYYPTVGNFSTLTTGSSFASFVTILHAYVNRKSLRTVNRLSRSTRVLCGDFFVPTLLQIHWRGFRFRLTAFSDLYDTSLPLYHSSIAISHTYWPPTKMLACHVYSLLVMVCQSLNPLSSLTLIHYIGQTEWSMDER